MHIVLRKGLDLALGRGPQPLIDAGRPVRRVALLGQDYPLLRPRLRVQEGDQVHAGQVLFVDPRDENIRYTAPGSGSVEAVNRGERRALDSLVLALDDADSAAPACAADLLPPAGAPASRADLVACLCASGLWTALRSRPFDTVPTSTETPRSLFVTAIDTRPLAADPAVIVARHPEAFNRGLQALALLTDGPLWLCTGTGWSLPLPEGVDSLRRVTFSGPHPAGLVGTHIHHLDPVSANRRVWYIGYQDVIAIGMLLLHRVHWFHRYVAVAGAGAVKPRILQTRLGAALDDLLQGEFEFTDGLAPRIVSGSVLFGHRAQGVRAFLGRYDQQVSLLARSSARRPLGWLHARASRPVFAGLLPRLFGGRPQPPHTALRGHPTALVPVEAFEHLLPLRLLPVPLLRALLVGDTQLAQALGCLELGEEDLALCTYMCPGKNDYGAVLRVNLQQIVSEG